MGRQSGFLAGWLLAGLCSFPALAQGQAQGRLQDQVDGLSHLEANSSPELGIGPAAASTAGVASALASAVDPPLMAMQAHVRRGWMRTGSPQAPTWLIAGSQNASSRVQRSGEIGLRGISEVSVPGTWRAVLEGPATFEHHARGLALGNFQRVLLDVSDQLRLELPEGQVLELHRCLVELLREPSGAITLVHHGGTAIEVDLGGRYTLLWRAGTRRAIPYRLTVEPARMRGANLGHGTYVTLPQSADGSLMEPSVLAPEKPSSGGLWPF